LLSSNHKLALAYRCSEENTGEEDFNDYEEF
jgi:hypothetical protein